MKALFKKSDKEKHQHQKLLNNLKKHFRDDEDEMEKEDEDEESEYDDEEDDEMEMESPLKSLSKFIMKKRNKPEEELDDIESQIQPGFPATEQEFEGVDGEGDNEHMRIPKSRRKEMAIIVLAKKLGKKNGKRET